MKQESGFEDNSQSPIIEDYPFTESEIGGFLGYSLVIRMNLDDNSRQLCEQLLKDNTSENGDLRGFIHVGDNKETMIGIFEPITNSSPMSPLEYILSQHTNSNDETPQSLAEDILNSSRS